MLKRVWEPFQIRHLELRNRLVRTAHTTGLAGDEVTAYHLERARGGVSLSVLEAASIHRESSPIGPDYSTDDVIPGLRKLTAAVNAAGMRTFQQFFHMGPHAPVADGGLPWAASPIAGAAGPARGISTEEIADIVSRFADCARRAREGGVDGIEIHLAHGYLLGSFLSPATNQRADQYGGSFENRLRIAREVIAAVRSEVGTDYIVGIRVSSEDGVQNGLIADEAARVASALTSGGDLDYVSTSCGNTGLQTARVIAPAIYPRGYELPFSRKIVAAVQVPTMVAGRFLSLEDAEAALERGDGDLIAMVRALIADPALIEKTRRGKRSRPCIGCNQGCVGGITSAHGRLECTVNAAAGHEMDLTDTRIHKTDTPRSVLIVGGGPAGLEAARVAAIAGHDVTLHEREQTLGGQLRLSRANPKRADTAAIIDWWEAELRRLGVEIVLGSDVDRTLVSEVGPDALIVATGSVPRRDGLQSMQPGLAIKGFSAATTLTSWDVLQGADVGQRTVVYDDSGHYEAIDVAEHLLGRGVGVEYVTRFANVGERLEGFPGSWGAIGQPHLEELLRHEEFTFHPRSLITEVGNGTATIASQDLLSRTRTVFADTVIMVSGGFAERPELDDLVADIHVVGDALQGPMLLQAAVLSGNRAARSLSASDHVAAGHELG